MPKVTSEKREDFHSGTWLSLLGLLDVTDCVVPVDQSSLWKRHIAWSKTDGVEIRDYTTQRFSSNMVFLSLLLGSEMSILFNSADFTSEIRHAVLTEQFYSIKFYIGCSLLLGACVSILGLVTTFTAWGMISAISDSNAHVLLRSSMGQYVTSLPSRFVVAALYLFLIWLMLFVVELMSGVTRLLLLSLMIGLFFQVVVSLSSFGRLIMHTGAMGKKRILDPEFERHLLPSGLHASLLLKATDRRRRRTSVVSQYFSHPTSSKTLRKISKETSRKTSLESNGDATVVLLSGRRSPSDDESYSELSHRSFRELNAEETDAIHTSAKAFSATETSEHMISRKQDETQMMGTHRREESSAELSIEEVANDDFNFPRPSVLNTAKIKELREMVEMTLSSREQLLQKSYDSVENDTPPNRNRRMAKRSSQVIYQQSVASTIQQEWKAEEEVRNMYNIDPPVEPVFDESEHSQGAPKSDFDRMPNIQLLNSTKNFFSLRRLLGSEQEDSSTNERHSLLQNTRPPFLNDIQEESVSDLNDLKSINSMHQLSPQNYNSPAVVKSDSSIGYGSSNSVESIDEEEGRPNAIRGNSGRIGKAAQKVFQGLRRSPKLK